MGTLYARSSAGWSSYGRRKLPPYAKQLGENLATGWQPAWTGSVFIATGDHAWNLGRQWAENASVSDRAFLVLQPGTDPSIYDWRVVAGRDCVAYDTGGLTRETADTLAALLLRAGADLVLVSIADVMHSYRPLRSGRAA